MTMGKRSWKARTAIATILGVAVGLFAGGALAGFTAISDALPTAANHLLSPLGIHVDLSPRQAAAQTYDTATVTIGPPVASNLTGSEAVNLVKQAQSGGSLTYATLNY